MKKFAKEFKDFIVRGNVVDLAIGVVIATSFGRITTSLVNDILMPFIGWLIGDIDLAQLNITLRAAVMDGETVVKEALVIGVGTLITTILNFIFIALVVFLIIKALNRAKQKEPEAPPPGPSQEELLLTEIRDILKAQNK